MVVCWGLNNVFFLFACAYAFLCNVFVVACMCVCVFVRVLLYIVSGEILPCINMYMYIFACAQVLRGKFHQLGGRAPHGQPDFAVRACV